MGFLGVDVGEAVRWIAEHFPVPNVKIGRPVGKRVIELTPYRVGLQGSELEVLVRSGMFGQFSAAERSILVALLHFRDPESGLARMSYGAIARYSGVASRASISNALRRLARFHAIAVHRGSRIGVTRECSAYEVTLEDPKFREACNQVFRQTREEVAQEREYRASLKRERQAQLRVKVTPAGGRRPPDPPHSLFLPKAEAKASTCEGLNLSSPDELSSNKPVQLVNREISIPPSGFENRQQELQRQNEMLRRTHPDWYRTEEARA